MYDEVYEEMPAVLEPGQRFKLGDRGRNIFEAYSDQRNDAAMAFAAASNAMRRAEENLFASISAVYPKLAKFHYRVIDGVVTVLRPRDE